MRIFTSEDPDFASVEQFRRSMEALGEGPASPDPVEGLGVYAIRRILIEATRPIRVMKAAHETPQPPLLPELPDEGLTQLTMGDIRLLAAHQIGVIVHPFKR